MKQIKWPAFLIAVALCAYYFAAPSSELAAADEKSIDVVASFYPMYIMAINVCKDVPGVTVASLTQPASGCLHDYSLTTNDMKMLAGADIVIANGAGMESFLNKIAAQYPDVKIVNLADGIPLIRGRDGQGDNPHIWVSVAGAMHEVRNLESALETFDPGHEDLYRKNTDSYLAKLEALRSRMQSGLAPFRGNKVITFHEAFPYFAEEFGLEIAGVVEREPGSQPSAKELAHTVDLVRQSGVKALFSESQYPSSAMDAIAKETGAAVYVLDPVVSGPDDPDAYLNIMEKNFTILKEALS